MLFFMPQQATPLVQQATLQPVPQLATPVAPQFVMQAALPQVPQPVLQAAPQPVPPVPAAHDHQPGVGEGAASHHPVAVDLSRLCTQTFIVIAARTRVPR